MVFLSRNWDKDKVAIAQTFRHLKEDPTTPFWLLSHPEGTRFSPKKLEECNNFAREHGHPELKHCLLPRTKGFVATVNGLRGCLESILDCTIVWDKPAGLDFYF